MIPGCAERKRRSDDLFTPHSLETKAEFQAVKQELKALEEAMPDAAEMMRRCDKLDERKKDAHNRLWKLNKEPQSQRRPTHAAACKREKKKAAESADEKVMFVLAERPLVLA